MNFVIHPLIYYYYHVLSLVPLVPPNAAGIAAKVRDAGPFVKSAAIAAAASPSLPSSLHPPPSLPQGITLFVCQIY